VLEWIGKRYMRMRRIRHEEQGFTLIELLVVVAIIGILVAIALPVFLGQRAKAEDARAQANVREAASAINVYFTENGTAPTAGTPPDWPDAGTVLAQSGFSGSNPNVFLHATGTADTAAWCVSTPGSGGDNAFWYQTQALGKPANATAADLPADCQAP
jgi:type IV pilus assembly protein PilA